MEIQLAAFFAEHNVAFLPSEHLVRVLKKGAKDSNIIKDIKLGKKKCSAVVRNIIAKTETEELVEILKTTPFSALIDESTDISNKKNMCILARYVAPSKKIETRLLELVELDARDCSAKALWEAFKKCLEKHQIPLENIIGLGTDHAAVMTGCENSFWTRLQAQCPWAILIGCVCHSAASVAKEAYKELPSYVLSHLRAVASYIRDSPKRDAKVSDFQFVYDVEERKILRFSTTRWLVAHPCVARYLENRETLLGYFRTAAREDPKDKEAASILSDMQNPFLECYLHFLNYSLAFMNEFNAMFQARDEMIHKLSSSSEKLLKKFCQNYITPESLGTKDISNSRYFLPIESVYLGPDCAAFLNNLNDLKVFPDAENEKEKRVLSKAEKDRLQAAKEKELRDAKATFRIKCLNFYVKAAAEMKKRLPTQKIFQEMAFLDPAKLLSPTARVEEGGLADLSQLVARFGAKFKLDGNKLAQEWRTLPIEIDGPLKDRILNMSVAEAWREISGLKIFADELVFPQLSQLATLVLSLPHSNAEAERTFSVVTDVKDKKRNKLGIENLNGIAVVRSSFSSKQITCDTFNVTEKHLDKFDSSIYQMAD